MRKLILFVVFISGFSTSIYAQPDIVGGEQADPQELPWMVYLETFLPPTHTSGCGGSLIAPQWVLTAAHCIDDDYEIKYCLINSLRKDTVNLASYSELYDVDTFFIHQGYEAIADLEGPDIALIRLSEPSPIAPLELADYGDTSLFSHGMPGRVSGWGFTDDPININPDTLMVADVSFYHPDSCAALYELTTLTWNFYELNEGGNICAGYFPGQAVGGAGAGDSGGPLFFNVNGTEKQVGIVSGGNGPLTTEDFPGVFTLVPEYRNWIDSVMALYEMPVSISTSDDLNRPTINYFANDLIEIENLNDEEYKLEIYLITGRLVHANHIAKGQTSYQMSISNFNQGVYVVVLKNKNQGWMVNRKIIVY